MTNIGTKLRAYAPYAVAAGLLAVAVASNVASTIDRAAQAGRPISLFTPLVDEITSAVVWLALLPTIGWAFVRLSPSRISWPAMVGAHALVIPIVSLTHFLATRALRLPIQALFGHASEFAFSWSSYSADLYKDVLNYLLFGFLYLGLERLLVPRPAKRESEKRTSDAAAAAVEIRDGAQTTYVPVAEICWVEAAGNYAEVHASGSREYLMRATLDSLTQRLESAGFLRIHRSRLVNLAAVTTVEKSGTGDAAVILSTGERISASRRYRPALLKALSARARHEGAAPPSRDGPAAPAKLGSSKFS